MEQLSTGFSPTTQDLKIPQNNATSQDIPTLAMSRIMYKIGTLKIQFLPMDQNFIYNFGTINYEWS